MVILLIINLKFCCVSQWTNGGRKVYQSKFLETLASKVIRETIVLDRFKVPPFPLWKKLTLQKEWTLPLFHILHLLLSYRAEKKGDALNGMDGIVYMVN